MPEEDKLEITTLSSNAFYYFGREELKHKLLLIEDLDGSDSVLYPLRELQSKRKITKTVTLKDNKGNLKTVQICFSLGSFMSTFTAAATTIAYTYDQGRQETNN